MPLLFNTGKIRATCFKLLLCACLLCACLLVGTAVVHGQQLNSVDSLNYKLSRTTNTDKKVDLILEFLDKPENQFLADAEDYAKRAYEISQQTDYAKGKINSMIKLGYYSFRKSDYNKSMDFAQKARELAEDLNFKKELAYSLRLMGTIYNELGDFNHSSAYFFESLRIFEEIKHKEGISQALGDIGMDFYYQNNYPKALEYYKKALALAVEIDNPSAIKRQYNNIASVYGNLNKGDTAIYYLKKAIPINKILHDHLGEATNTMNIGFNQLNSGDFTNALNSFQGAMEIFQSLDNKTRIAESHLNIGYCYQALNSIDNSIYHFTRAIDIAKEIKHYTVIQMASQALDDIYTRVKRDTISAYKYVLLEKTANDSLYHLQNLKQLSTLEMQYLFEKQELERKQSQRAKDTIIIITILSLISGLVILTLAMSRFRLKSKNAILEKEKIKNELNIKKQELSVNLISLIRKNEMLSDVSDDLIQLEKKTENNEAKEVIELISRKLRSGTGDKMLKEFSAQFQEVHAGFYDSLLKLYPDLTQNELRLCALLRLNMSTKDISELTGQAQASIDKARYRLRKKLHISNSDQNLVSFLSQMQ